jgi:hypothetical protein
MPSLAEENLDSICKEILQLDNSIRFAGILLLFLFLVIVAIIKKMLLRTVVIQKFLIFNKKQKE